MNGWSLVLCLQLIPSRILLLDIWITLNLITTSVEICLAFDFAHLGIFWLSQSPRILSPTPNRGTACFVPNRVINKCYHFHLLIYEVCLSTYLLVISLHSQQNSLKTWRPKQALYFYMLILDSGEVSSTLPSKSSSWEKQVRGGRNEERIPNHRTHAWWHHRHPTGALGLQTLLFVAREKGTQGRGESLCSPNSLQSACPRTKHIPQAPWH